MISVVGISKKTFNFNDGNSVSGLYLHLVFDDPDVDGQAVERVFVSYTKLSDYIPDVGDIIDIRYTRYGKVKSVELIK